MLTLTWCPFHPVLLQWNVKDPGNFAKRAAGRFKITPKHAYTLDSMKLELADYAAQA